MNIEYICNQKIKKSQHANLKMEDDLKKGCNKNNQDSLKYEDEDNRKNEDHLKLKKMLHSRQSPALVYMTLVVIVVTSFVPYSCRYMSSLYCLFANLAQILNSVPNTYSNIFVQNYEYRIYSFLATWPNMNIEYIRS